MKNYKIYIKQLFIAIKKIKKNKNITLNDQ